MANSEFEYVRKFEQQDALPLSNWIVVRIDGRGFSKLTRRFDFTKPNDDRGLALMNAAAQEVVKSVVDIVLAYGQSDEYSFVLHESTTLFERRAAKLATTIATTFTAEYCMQWPTFFTGQPLTQPYPTFDGRCVCYPKKKILRDYLSWRQADAHINNLYNTTFWNLVGDGVTTTDAEQMLKGTLSSDKNEILFKRFGINYNNEPEIYRKGTIIYRAYDTSTPTAPTKQQPSKTQIDKERKRKQKASIVVEHRDIIGASFWEEHPYILGTARGVAGAEDE